MWDWLRARWRSNRPRASQPDNLTSENREGDRNSLIRRPLLFSPRPVINCFPPKCIGRYPCSQILYGERLEDFSSDCWLENHLHRFGSPESNEIHTETLNSPFEDSSDDSATGVDTMSSGYSLSLVEIEIQNSLNTVQSQHRLNLEELFIPLIAQNHGESSTDIQEVDMPPPYSPFEEPPPTYEEAVGEQERRSVGSLSSSSSAFMW